MKAKTLLNRLNTACWTCQHCGDQFGRHIRTSTWHDGKCDVCKSKASVTEARDFDYFRLEKRKLSQALLAEARTKLKPTKIVKVKKVTQKSLTNLKKELRKVTHAIVRHGATKCYTCGEKNKPLYAGHWQTDGAHSATRYDLDNIRPQCDQCNRWQSGNLAEYTIKLQKELGPARFEALYQRSKQIHKWTRDELEQMIIDRKEKLRQLQSS